MLEFGFELDFELDFELAGTSLEIRLFYHKLRRR